MIILRTNFNRKTGFAESINQGIPVQYVEYEDEAASACRVMNAFCKQFGQNYHYCYVSNSIIDFDNFNFDEDCKN